jgi:hypothetical protein
MQLGTRWAVGATPPERISDAMKARIASVEVERESNDTSMWRWTLTWLEGHPRAELEDGTVVREDYDGSIIVDVDELDL